MVTVITRFPAREGCHDGAIRTVWGPFEDEDAARAWAESHVDERIMWTTEDLTTPW